MSKGQQIKEIQKLICNNCGQIDGCKISCKAHKSLAEALYNAGYRKVIYGRDNLSDLLNEEVKELSLIEKTRKETAREFMEKLKVRLAKFIWRHNIPECIYNDVMEGLLKEYERNER